MKNFYLNLFILIAILFAIYIVKTEIEPSLAENTIKSLIPDLKEKDEAIAFKQSYLDSIEGITPMAQQTKCSYCGETSTIQPIGNGCHTCNQGTMESDR